MGWKRGGKEGYSPTRQNEAWVSNAQDGKLSRLSSVMVPAALPCLPSGPPTHSKVYDGEDIQEDGYRVSSTGFLAIKLSESIAARPSSSRLAAAQAFEGRQQHACGADRGTQHMTSVSLDLTYGA